MLRVEDLQIRRGRKTVLADITLDLLPGEVLGVLGPNGAGKSTLLGALCGELQPDQGRVWLDQRELKDWGGAQRAQRLAGVVAARPFRLSPSPVPPHPFYLCTRIPTGEARPTKVES